MAHIEELTGKPVILVPDASLAGKARGKAKAARPDSSAHVITFDPGKADFLNHVIPHEIGHILRLWSVPEDDRMLFLSSPEHRVAAGRQMANELLPLMRRGLYPDDIAKLLPIWEEGVLTQLNSTPADIHIERWINREFPALRRAQNAALETMLAEYDQSLRPTVRRLTPPTIYRASVAMNYAFTKAIAQILEEPKVLRPYRDMLEAATGERLYAIAQSIGDDGHVGDRVTTDRWASELHLSGWYRWVKIDEVRGSSYSQGKQPNYGAQT